MVSEDSYIGLDFLIKFLKITSNDKYLYSLINTCNCVILIFEFFGIRVMFYIFPGKINKKNIIKY